MTAASFEPLPYAYAKAWQCVARPAAPAGSAVTGGAAVDCVAPPPPAVLACLCSRYPAIRFKLVDEAAFNRALGAAYEDHGGGAAAVSAQMAGVIDLAGLEEGGADAHDLLIGAADAPVIRLINAILTEAVRAEASDVHVETFERRVSVRFRVDGVLRDSVSPDRELAGMLTSRVKVMAKLDIAEKRLPQDGRMALQVAGRLLDVRVSTLPTRHGERLVLRLLEKDSVRSLEQLGLSAEQGAMLRSWLARPHGVLLVTGPTGSGKSTTLYAALRHLDDGLRNILTVEDPVEVDMEGIGQTQVNAKVGMSFARGLRAILRQDPDVVMVGEIRDPETAKIAVQASLTGHLVLSTLHTNTALGAAPRLRELGVEPFLLASSLTGIMAQRLVRKICGECIRPRAPLDWEREFLQSLGGEPPAELYRGTGCAACGRSGYRGRTAIYDLVPADDELRQWIHRGAAGPAPEPEGADGKARRNGLLLDGIAKAAQGITTLEEAARVAGSE